MSTQLLIYETAAPLSAKRHARWCVDTSGGYGFSRKVNSVPLMAVEFAAAAAEYPIVFTAKGETALPVALLGIRGQENLFLDRQGSWQARYIPAFIRRYPFVFANGEQAHSFTLCIDEAYAGCNQDGRGERLFTDDGALTPYVEKILHFLKDYQSQIQRTQAICRKLKELDLLEPMQAQVQFPDGKRLSLRGFLAVERGKLKALAPEVLADLARSDALELIYLHLESIRNFEAMRERLQATTGSAGNASSSPAMRGNGASQPVAS